MYRFILSSALLVPGLFAAGGAGGFDIMQFIPILLIFVIFYFLILRPQQKKARTHQEMLKALHKGDRVVTAGGIFAVVDKIIDDSQISIEIADGVKIKVLKSAVTDVVTRTPQAAVAFSKETVEKKTEEKKAPIAIEKATVQSPKKDTKEKSAAAPAKKKATATKKTKS